MFFVDFTSSNNHMGALTFNNQNLHKLFPPGQPFTNPYQDVLAATVPVMDHFDDDQTYPIYAFGDSTTGNYSVRQLHYGRGAKGVREVMDAYTQAVSNLRLYGPTCFIPALIHAVNHVRVTRTYTIVVIIGDGEVLDTASNHAFLAQVVSRYPISVIMVGVGDGCNAPGETRWAKMKAFDDDVKRALGDEHSRDVFQFVDFYKETRTVVDRDERQARLLTQMMAEVPAQFKYAREKELSNNCMMPDKVLAEWKTKIDKRAPRMVQ